MYYQRKVAFYTLGCKLNFSETSAIARTLTDNGFEKVDFSEVADYYIINTCSVTDNADKKCRATIRQALRRNPEAKVVIIGCYAQLKPERIAEMEGVSMVLGANEKFKLLEHLQELDHAQQTLVHAGDIKEVNFYSDAFSYGERTRTFLKVQDGCDYFCSFCTIPLARGRSRSAGISEVMQTARDAAATGVKEIVLTGVNTGDFGKTADGRRRTNETFYDLIQQLETIQGVERWRISSIEPNLLSDEIIRFVAKSDKFVPHFHIPLQSGSDKLLKAMRRKYDSSLYESRIELIKELMPHACIGVDVIVGFPGETEDEFLTTYEFLNALPVSYLHVFTYSERPDTVAVKMDEVVDPKDRARRSKMLRSLSAKKRRYFYSQFVGDVRQVLWEAENDEGYMYGYTDNYIKVRGLYKEELVNTICPVRIKNITASCVAEITPQPSTAEYA